MYQFNLNQYFSLFKKTIESYDNKSDIIEKVKSLVLSLTKNA